MYSFSSTTSTSKRPNKYHHRLHIILLIHQTCSSVARVSVNGCFVLVKMSLKSLLFDNFFFFSKSGKSTLTMLYAMCAICVQQRNGWVCNAYGYVMHSQAVDSRCVEAECELQTRAFFF